MIDGALPALQFSGNPSDAIGRELQQDFLDPGQDAQIIVGLRLVVVTTRCDCQQIAQSAHRLALGQGTDHDPFAVERDFSKLDAFFTTSSFHGQPADHAL